MYLIGFLRSTIPMLECIAGIYLFTVRRENCQKKFHLCVGVVIAIEFLVYYFMFIEDAEGQGYIIAKILTTLMISLMVFWGGLYVYGGWSRIGFFIFLTDITLGITERVYWLVWEYLSHQSAERAVIYYQSGTVVDSDAFPMYLYDCIMLIPFLIGGYKLRDRPLRPQWLIKALVIFYLALGGSPLVNRPGFENEFDMGVLLFVVEFVWIVLAFLILMTISITAARENRQILYLRKHVAAEQSRIMMTQREKVRRLRHDVKKHLSNLEYILEKEPALCSDPSLLSYQEKLNDAEEWLRGGYYCDSSALNLCFEQIKRYCDSAGIRLDIGLKRLNFSGWTQDDQLMFGTLLLNLIQWFGSVRSASAVRFSGDCLLGQNVLRITPEIESGTGQKDQNRQKDRIKNRKRIADQEKAIQLVLSKYEGRIEREDDGENPAYVLNWMNR